MYGPQAPLMSRLVSAWYLYLPTILMLPLQTLRRCKKLGVLNVVVYSGSRSKKGIEIPATGRVGTQIRNTKSNTKSYYMYN
jgi:hypothetical protein